MPQIGIALEGFDHRATAGKVGDDFGILRLL